MFIIFVYYNFFYITSYTSATSSSPHVNRGINLRINIIELYVYRESIARHELTVVVKDQSTPSKKNFARVVITVIDSNDHAPEFSSNIVQGRVFETTAVGTSVLQLLATDKDHGENAAVSYQIISGKSPVIVTTNYIYIEFSVIMKKYCNIIFFILFS